MELNTFNLPRMRLISLHCCVWLYRLPCIYIAWTTELTN